MNVVFQANGGPASYISPVYAFQLSR
jgi:hypothetical protein